MSPGGFMMEITGWLFAGNAGMKLMVIMGICSLISYSPVVVECVLGILDFIVQRFDLRVRHVL